MYARRIKSLFTVIITLLSGIIKRTGYAQKQKKEQINFFHIKNEGDRKCVILNEDFKVRLQDDRSPFERHHPLVHEYSNYSNYCYTYKYELLVWCHVNMYLFFDSTECFLFLMDHQDCGWRVRGAQHWQEQDNPKE